MRIAFFTDTYLPNIDGVVTAILNFRKGLEEQGNEVFVFSSGNKEDKDNNQDQKVFFYTGFKFPPYPQYKIALFPFSSKREVEEKGIEMVHSHAVASMGLAAIKTATDLDLPLIGTYHTMLSQGGVFFSQNKTSRKIASSIAWRAVKAFYKPFDQVTTPSNAMCLLMKENGIEEVVSIPNPVDLKKYNTSIDSSVARKLQGLQDEKLVIVSGRLSPEKNVDVVLKAAKIVCKSEKARFVITGDGPSKNSLMKQCAALRLNKEVKFTGFLPSEHLPFYYSSANLLCTASTFETQGLSILEAMACGKPCVGANALAIPEAIEDGKNGYLFEPSSEEECAEKILKVLQADGWEYNSLCENARKTAEKYSLDNCTRQLMEVYEKTKEKHT